MLPNTIIKRIKMVNVTYFLGGIITFGFVYLLTFIFSQSHRIALFCTLLAIPLFIATIFFVLSVRDNLTKQKKQRKSVLLLSHDDEVLGQLLYLLPHEYVGVEFVRTFESAIKHLKHKKPDAFIIDTSNKLKNTTNLIELCRSQHIDAYRLPIAAVQKDASPEVKRQRLLEGFDDCLPKPIKENDADLFYSRWLLDMPVIEPAQNTIKPDLKVETPPTSSSNNDKTSIFDKELALAQSHHNIGLAKDMLSMLIKLIEDNKDSIKQYYLDKDWNALHEITHKIKGGCYCTGLPTFEKTMEAIDQSLEKNQHQNIDQEYESMMNQIDDVLLWFRQQNLNELFAE